MNGKDQNCLEFFDEIKGEWCRSEEQHKPFWNDVLTFARLYHKMMKEVTPAEESTTKIKHPAFLPDGTFIGTD